MPRRVMRTGLFALCGQVIVLPGDDSHLLGTEAAARFIGVSPSTIRQWRKRGRLSTQGLDERGYPLHSREAIRAADETVREKGLEWSGVDPRRLRKPPAASEAA